MLYFPPRFWLAAWYAMPGVMLTVLLMLSYGLSQTAWLKPFMPVLPWLGLYYWGMKSPSRLPYLLLFALGYLQDTLAGTPPGLSALLWIAMRWLVGWAPKEIHDAGFLVAWGFFAVLAFFMLHVEWVLISLVMGGMDFPSVILLKYLLTVLLYPSFHRIGSLADRALYRRVWHLLKR